MSDRTKLFFDLENKKPFLAEGGKPAKKTSKNKSSSGKKKDKVKSLPVPEEDKSGFIQKVYGLFSFQVATQLIYVILISQSDKAGGLVTFAKSWTALAVGIILAIIATFVVVKAKSDGQVPVGKGYACWLLQTVGLTLVAGFIAAK